MKRFFIFIVIYALAITISTPKLEAADTPFLSSTVVKTFFDRNSYPPKEQEVALSLMTNSDIQIPSTEQSVVHALKYHEMLCEAFSRRGWRAIHPLDAANTIGAIELTFESRMNLKLKETKVIKTFLYVCDRDRLWNMVKYRGGSHLKYFEKVADKAENCILEKIGFSRYP